MLLGIKIKNLYVFPELKIGNLLEDYATGYTTSSFSMLAGLPPNIALSNLTAFIGRNDTGKSLFFDCLSFLSDCVTKGIKEAAAMKERGSFSNMIKDETKPVEFELFFCLSGEIVQAEMINTGRDTMDDVVQSPFHGSIINEQDIFVSFFVSICSDKHGRPLVEREVVKAFSWDGKPFPAIEKDQDQSFDSLGHVCLDFWRGKGKILFGQELVDGISREKDIFALRSYGAIMHFPILATLYKEISHWFFCKFTEEKTWQFSGITSGGHKHLNSSGTNLSNVLTYLETEDPQLYESIIQKIMHKIPTAQKKYMKLPEFLKDSPNKLFLYLLLLYDPYPRSLICMEAPDMGLYHDMVDVLAQEFRNFTVQHAYSQIFFTTHNPYILDAVAPPEVCIFKRDTPLQTSSVWNAGANPLISEMYKEGVSMGSLWYSGYFE